MNGTVLDILLYVFDRYMFDEAPEVPERDALARQLASAGFGEANVERALDWLADLAGLRNNIQLPPMAIEGVAKPTPALRLYSTQEIERLSAECRGMLLTLEAADILQPAQRELVIDRLLAPVVRHGFGQRGIFGATGRAGRNQRLLENRRGAQRQLARRRGIRRGMRERQPAGNQ